MWVAPVSGASYASAPLTMGQPFTSGKEGWNGVTSTYLVVSWMIRACFPRQHVSACESSSVRCSVGNRIVVAILRLCVEVVYTVEAGVDACEEKPDMLDMCHPRWVWVSVPLCRAWLVRLVNSAGGSVVTETAEMLRSCAWLRASVSAVIVAVWSVLVAATFRCVSRCSRSLYTSERASAPIASNSSGV
jgi:hypothetical protein